MNRLLMSACLAAFAMSGALPDANAAETAAAETAAPSTGSSKTGAKASPGKVSSANPVAPHAKTTAAKTLSAKTSSAKTPFPKNAVTKAAREIEAVEAVSTADAPQQSADANATDQPADTPGVASQSADANPGDRPDAAAADPQIAPQADPNADAQPDPKAAKAKPAHMNTGHPQIDALVATHAKTNDVPEALIHRVIVRESKYQKDLVGHCGCIGLMQIKLGTARGLGYTGDAQGLHDANTNLTYGVKYLAGAYRAARGDHDRAVHYFAKGYYEVAKQQRLADIRPLGKPERLHAPLDITPKPVAAAHPPKRVAAVTPKPAAAGVSASMATAK
jgi:soluble lytic murein transglycosylase-like protein